MPARHRYHQWSRGSNVLPPVWYLLLAFCAIMGVLTWYLRNLTDDENWIKVSAGFGICGMIALVVWTFSLDI